MILFHFSASAIVASIDVCLGHGCDSIGTRTGVWVVLNGGIRGVDTVKSASWYCGAFWLSEEIGKLPSKLHYSTNFVMFVERWNFFRAEHFTYMISGRKFILNISILVICYCICIFFSRFIFYFTFWIECGTQTWTIYPNSP